MEKYQVKLIDNTYSGSEAKELLTALINDKIRFLKRKIFSIQERTGENPTHLQKRISELQVERDRLINKFEELGEKDYKVEIDCHAFLKIKAGGVLV